MDILKHKFEKIRLMQKTDQKILHHAKEEGFYCCGNEWTSLFSRIFFGDPDLEVKFKEEIPEEKLKEILGWFSSYAKSFDPKHEEKEAVCAFILSKIVDRG